MKSADGGEEGMVKRGLSLGYSHAMREEENKRDRDVKNLSHGIGKAAIIFPQSHCNILSTDRLCHAVQLLLYQSMYYALYLCRLFSFLLSFPFTTFLAWVVTAT